MRSPEKLDLVLVAEGTLGGKISSSSLDAVQILWFLMHTLYGVPSVHPPELLWVPLIFQPWFVGFLLVFWDQICFQWFSYCLKILRCFSVLLSPRSLNETLFKNLSFSLIKACLVINTDRFVYNSWIFYDYLIS